MNYSTDPAGPVTGGNRVFRVIRGSGFITIAPGASEDIPERLRPQPPFNRNGTLRQGYCYPFPSDVAIELLQYFGDLSLPDLPAQ